MRIQNQLVKSLKLEIEKYLEIQSEIRLESLANYANIQKENIHNYEEVMELLSSELQQSELPQTENLRKTFTDVTLAAMRFGFRNNIQFV